MPPPYGIISGALKRGGVVPFLGAGVNYGARPDNAGWEPHGCSFLPDGKELSKYLASLSNFPAAEDRERCELAKVASYFADVGGRRELCTALRQVFDRDVAPAGIHTCLAQVAKAAKQPLLLITTNYDDLLERAFVDLPYMLVSHLTDDEENLGSVLLWSHEAGAPSPTDPRPVPPSKLAAHVDLERTTVIYKMHGAVDRRQADVKDSWVITEDDYVDFLSRMQNNSAIPAAFVAHLKQRQLLFLGYGLGDWNLRLALHNVFANRAKNLGPSWAIQFKPSALEERLWDSRRVDIYDVDIKEFASQLCAAVFPPPPAAAAAAPIAAPAVAPAAADAAAAPSAAAAAAAAADDGKDGAR